MSLNGLGSHATNYKNSRTMSWFDELPNIMDCVDKKVLKIPYSTTLSPYTYGEIYNSNEAILINVKDPKLDPKSKLERMHV